MTKQEYADYQEHVAAHLKGLESVSTGPCPGCEECGLSDEPTEQELQSAGEPFFSWRECEICKSHLGGNREPWHAVMCDETRDGEPLPDRIVHGTCCEDCVYYLNYGRLDDVTMSSIEQE